jgi:methylmalonyl-CoA/ethylmalonyl-CoA epimerase
MQPLEGPSIDKEFLDQKGEELQHMTVLAPSENVDLALQSFKKNGMDVVMSVRTGENIRFYYMDTAPVLKMVAEMVSGHVISLKPVYTYP